MRDLRQEQPSTPLPASPLTREEWQHIVVDWNQTATDVSGLRCLHQLVEIQAQHTPSNFAVECANKKLTYAEFNARANQLAHHLRRRGVEPGARVALCLQATPDFAVASLAVLKAGAACVPLDPKYPADRLLFMVEDSGVQLILTAPGAPQLKITFAPELDLTTLSAELDSEPHSNPDVRVSLSDPAYVIYTSGSTGKPRGVLLAHEGLANYVTAAARYYAMSPQDRLLQFCSISFDIALEEFFITWLSGATLVFHSGQFPLAAPEFVAWIRRNNITVLDLPTAFWHEWVTQFEELPQPVPANLRLVIVGGEKALSSALSTWRRAAGTRVRWVNTYGPTEASIAVTRFELDFSSEAELPANIPIGRPVENCQIYLLDPNLNPVPVGAPGELHIGGICLASGYLNRPDLTAEKFIPNPFSRNPASRLYKTGDLARYLPSGDLEYLGRLDEQVKIRGFRVELSEIEELLARHPLVREVAVVAVDDDHRGKSVVAHVVLAKDAHEPQGLREYAARKLPDYMVPSAFVSTDALPRTPNGKIDRRALAAQPFPNVRTSRKLEAPADEFEQQLLRLWEETLGHNHIGVQDSFFELGGHSLLAARLMHRLSRTTGQTIPLALLFEAPTVRQLAPLLREQSWSQRVSCLVPIQPAGEQPPFFCVHGVGGNVLGFRELARRMGSNHPFYGLQSQGLDGKGELLTSIEAMAEHYIREMRSAQPEGPFLIGGYSFGGLVAYEMAQQLTAGGEHVALLALLDTYPGDLEPVGLSMLRLARNPRLAVMHDLPQIAKASLQRRVKGLFLSPVLKRVLQANQQASAQYVLQPYGGRVTLFRAEEFSLRSVDDPHAAWNELTPGGLDVHEIAGGHGDILVPPQVAELADKLKSCIHACTTTRPASPPAMERALA